MDVWAIRALQDGHLRESLIRIAERARIHCNSSHACPVRMVPLPRLHLKECILQSLSNDQTDLLVTFMLMQCHSGDTPASETLLGMSRLDVFYTYVSHTVLEESLALNTLNPLALHSPSLIVLPLLPMPSALLSFRSKAILCICKGAWAGCNC